MSVSKKTKRVFVGLVSVGIAISTFVLADMAMPDEVKWFMRWWLAGVALVCYFAGAAYAAYLMRERINEIENCNADALKEKEAAIQREREKNAELAARWEKLNSEERRKRKAFDVLNDRERWLLAAILDMSPMVPSSNDNKIVPYLRSMCSEGILLDTGTVTVKGVKKESYVISVGWRKWLADHADELPDPHSDMPE